MAEFGLEYLKATRLCLGTWAIGGGDSWGPSYEKESIRTISEAIDLGVNYIDTAPAYGNGDCEEIIGKALAGKRNEVFLATKCGLTWNYDNPEKSEHMRRDGFVIRRDLESVEQQLDDSLRRLKTDNVDMLLTHWQDSQVPIEETVNLYERLIKKGKIRFFGSCNNESVDNIRAYGSHLSMVQERFSLLSRANRPLLDECEKLGVLFQAYSPLERGLLSGTLTKDTKVYGIAKKKIVYFQMEYRDRVLRYLSKIQEIADSHSCKVIHVVLAWTMQTCHMVICGARKPWQIEDAAKARDIHLSKEEIMFLDKLTL